MTADPSSLADDSPGIVLGAAVGKTEIIPSIARQLASVIHAARVAGPFDSSIKPLEEGLQNAKRKLLELIANQRRRTIIPCQDCSGQGWTTQPDPGTGDATQVECERCYGTGETLPTIAALQVQVKSWTAAKGWADNRTVGDLLMLMVSELAEALEEYRDWHEPNAVRVQNGKPEGIPIELADVVIRILSFCGKYDVDLQEAVLQKMAYNETREHRHGGKRV